MWRSTSWSARWPSAASRARTLAVGSLGGVAAASRGECDVAPVHLIDPATGIYNVHLVTPGLALVPGWRRMQGFCSAPATSASKGARRQDALKAALADPTALMVNRNAGSGTRVLVDKLLAGARPAGYANQPKSHNAVAAAIAQSRADWGVAIEPVAQALWPRLPADRAGTLRFPAGREPRASGRRCRLSLRRLRDPATRAAHPRPRHAPRRRLSSVLCCARTGPAS